MQEIYNLELKQLDNKIETLQNEIRPFSNKETLTYFGPSVNVMFVDDEDARNFMKKLVVNIPNKLIFSN